MKTLFWVPTVPRLISVPFCVACNVPPLKLTNPTELAFWFNVAVLTEFTERVPLSSFSTPVVAPLNTNCVAVADPPLMLNSPRPEVFVSQPTAMDCPVATVSVPPSRLKTPVPPAVLRPPSTNG